MVCVDGPILLNSRPMVRSKSTPVLSPNSRSSLDEFRGFTHVPSIDSLSPDDAGMSALHLHFCSRASSPPLRGGVGLFV